MDAGLRVILLLFALVGFGGTGASLGVARYRQVADGERDIGMLGVALMLFIFGALCTAVAAGASGILAFGGVAMWASYVLMAQHLGLFRVTTRRTFDAETPEEEESQPLK